ncbi:MAG: NUDIX hydrolase [Bacteroidetes bacterium]|nr:NUDIX hydrolase [Bacteroidota bacterium]
MKNWKKLHEEIIYKGWRGVIRKRFELPDGQISEFDIVDNHSFVTVAAFTCDKEAILVRQFRPGPEIELISFPEGAIDNGESPEQTAYRELLEETGYVAGKIIFLREFRSSYSNQKEICMLAVDCKLVSDQKLDQNEFIDVFTMPLNRFRQYIGDSGNTAFTNVAAAYLALNKME